MRAFRPSAEPATIAKIRDLVALHHGVPSGQSLVARRRRVSFDRISPDCFPVVLELSGSGQLVILSEKDEPAASGEDTYIVQFPDSRESRVHAERLKSLYSGTCIMLRPEERRSAQWSERFRRLCSCAAERANVPRRRAKRCQGEA
ncbi:MAG TPA: hypothetical protein PLA50_08375 [Bacteroidia bacterium]|nr:hypothetical protein [Bacteroidia bacterium]